MKLALTLIVSFVMIIFGFFNNGFVTVNLMGFKTLSLPLSVFFFFIFVAGAVFAAILSIEKQIDQALMIRKLKKKVLEYKEIMEDQDARGPIDNQKSVAGKEESQEKYPEAAQVQQQNHFLSMFQKKAKKEAVPAHQEQTPAPVRQHDKKEVAEQRSGSEKPDIEGLTMDDDDEVGLSAQLKEIAQRKIQNG